MREASAVSDHYPTHAQLFEPHRRPIQKAFCNVIDGGWLAVLKRFENNFINVRSGLPVLVHRIRCHSRSRCLASSRLNHLAGDRNAARPVNAILMPTPRLKFIFDLMEPERPKVDRAVLGFVTAHVYDPADFVIRADGVCRLNPEMARMVVRILPT